MTPEQKKTIGTAGKYITALIALTLVLLIPTTAYKTRGLVRDTASLEEKIAAQEARLQVLEALAQTAKEAPKPLAGSGPAVVFYLGSDAALSKTYNGAKPR